MPADPIGRSGQLERLQAGLDPILKGNRFCDAIGPNPAQFKWRGRDGNDPSLDIAKDAEHRF